MPTEKEFQDLKALVAQIAATPKVKPYLDGGQWPRRVMVGEGTISSGEQDKLAFEAAHPKSSKLIAAEEAVEAARVEFQEAQRALLEASRVEPGGQYLHRDGMGNNVVVDVPADSLVQIRNDVPEWRIFEAAEKKLVGLKVKLFGLQKARDAERIAWDQKRNPIKNPSKDEGKSWASRVRLAPFGGKR